jgi:hypothetical protein
MKYLLMMNIRPDAGTGLPWSPEDMAASGKHMQQIW